MLRTGEHMQGVVRDYPTVEEIRVRNGFRVLVAAFTTVTITFAAALWLWASHVGNDTIKSSDIVALLGVMTAIVGTLVGSYFGISSANSAKDSMSSQLTSANNARDAASSALSTATSLNTSLSARLPSDVATPIVDQHGGKTD